MYIMSKNSNDETWLLISLRPGWPSRKEEKVKNSKKDSFRDFENDTSDAWDDGDDDLIQMANLRISLRDVQTSAKVVLDNHTRKALSLQEQWKQGGESSLHKSNTCCSVFFLCVH